ncbi:MAG: FliA/WhiG family RNA polymerase sigma factor [Actinobacteria bacterium]|nr:FliA/WhiG family RNA polymerase sigma factor [Actinomycetota bacterium]
MRDGSTGSGSGSESESTKATEDELVREHLSLVHYAVADMASRLPKHVSRDDLVSAGMAGLAQAARSFDPGRGIRFDRYASGRIRGALLDELRSCDWASRTVRTKARRLNEASDSLTAKLGRKPTTEEVAGQMGCARHEVENNAADVHRALVLNYESLFADASAEDMLASTAPTPDDIIVERERKAYLADAVAALPERLRHVVVGYFFEERSMADLGEELGVSESRISQMRAEALSFLRDGMTSELEPDDAPVADTARNSRRRQAYRATVAGRSTYQSRLTPLR